MYNPIHHRNFCVTFERQITGKGLVHYYTKRKDIAAAVYIGALCLLRRHICRSTQGVTRGSDPGSVDCFCKAEIHNFDPAFFCEHDIVGFNVAMDDIRGVSYT